MTVDGIRLCGICQQPLATRGIATRTCDRSPCRVAYRQYLADRRVCAYCGEPMRPGTRSAGNIPHCDSLRCQSRHAQQQAHPASSAVEHRCQVCGVFLTTPLAAGGLCQDRDCQVLQATQVMRDKRRVRLQEYLKLKQLAVVRRTTDAAEHGPENFQDYAPIVVPHLPNQLVPRDPQRVAALADILQLILTTIAAEPESQPFTPDVGDWATESSDDGHIAVYRLGCTLCRGACCRWAGDQAYLDRQTLLRRQFAAPELTDQQLIQQYLDAVPETSVEGSCIFHGPRGCVLAREMRAKVCNQFLCAPLMDAQLQMTCEGRQTFYMASGLDDQIVASDFIQISLDPSSKPQPGTCESAPHKT